MPKFVTFPFDSVAFEKEEHTSNDKPLLFVTFCYLTLKIFLATIEATIQRNLLCLLLFVTSAQPCVPSAVQSSVCLSVCGTLTDARVKQCCLSRFLYEERYRRLTLTATLGFNDKNSDKIKNLFVQRERKVTYCRPRDIDTPARSKAERERFSTRVI